MSVFLSQTRNIFDTKQEFIFIWTNLNVIFIQIKKKLHLSGHYIFSIKFEAFFLQTKMYPTLQKLNGQISNIVLIFFFRER
jgi:hypothetical protein